MRKVDELLKMIRDSVNEIHGTDPNHVESLARAALALADRVQYLDELLVMGHVPPEAWRYVFLTEDLP